MNVVEKIFKPYEMDGVSCMILTGRDLYDYEPRPDKTLCTIFTAVAEYARDKHHMVVVRYSLSDGIVVPYHIYAKGDCDIIKRVSSDFSTNNQGNASQEFVTMLNWITKLSGTEIRWSDGNKMKFLFIIEYGSDIIPTASTTNQMIARELLFKLNASTLFINSENLLVLSDVYEGRIDEQLRGVMQKVFLDYPTYEQKLCFIDALHNMYPNAFSTMSDEEIANLASSTPNRTTERLFRAAHNNKEGLKAQVLIAEKAKDIARISEDTLSLLDTSRATGVNLVGSNIRIAKEFVLKQAQGLRERNKNTYSNILFAGGPGTGKTALAYTLSNEAHLPMLELRSPKNGVVGETERLAALQARIFSSTTPSIGFIDEFTEAFPSSRSSTNLDGGASDAVLGTLLTTLSDNRREGKSCLITTTNCISKISSAMLDRFLVVPVLMPNRHDLRSIICSIAHELSGVELDINDPLVHEAAHIFYDKHIMARGVRAVLIDDLQRYRYLTPEKLLESARDAMPLAPRCWVSSVVADLDAINNTISTKYYPWYGQENSYLYPEYIRNILDGNMQVDPGKLEAELNRLRPYANV